MLAVSIVMEGNWSETWLYWKPTGSKVHSEGGFQYHINGVLP